MSNIKRLRSKRLFAYLFAPMELRTRMYIALGSSMKSEKEAYDRVMDFLSSLDIEMDSVRLDRYYSVQSYVDKLEDTKVFIIPKRNANLNGSQKCKNTMREFVEDTMNYLEQYHLRSNSELEFSADKKMLRWNVAQRRYDRIDSTLFWTGMWHTIFQYGQVLELYPTPFKK